MITVALLTLFQNKRLILSCLHGRGLYPDEGMEYKFGTLVTLTEMFIRTLLIAVKQVKV